MNCCLKALANVKFVEQRIEDDSDYIKSRLVTQVETSSEQTSKDLVHTVLHESLNAVGCSLSSHQDLPELPPLIGTSEFKTFATQSTSRFESVSKPNLVKEDSEPEIEQDQEQEPIRGLVSVHPDAVPIIPKPPPVPPIIPSQLNNVQKQNEATEKVLVPADARSVDKHSISSRESVASSRDQKQPIPVHPTASQKSSLFDESDEESEQPTSSNTRFFHPPSSSPSPAFEPEKVPEKSKEEIIKKLPAGARAVLPMANEIQAQIQKKQLSAEKKMELNSSDHGEITQKRQPPVYEKIERRSIEPKKKEESPVIPNQDKKDDEKPVVEQASVQKQEQKQAPQTRSIFDSDSDDGDLFKSISASARHVPPITRKQVNVPVKPEATASSKVETVNREMVKESTNVSKPSASKSLTNEQRSAKYRSIFDDSDDEGDIFISKQRPIVKQEVRKTPPQTNSSTSHQKADTEDQQKPELKVNEQPNSVRVTVKQEINEDKVEEVEVAKELVKSQEVTPEKQSVPISVQSEEKEKPPSEKPVSAEAAEARSESTTEKDDSTEQKLNQETDKSSEPTTLVQEPDKSSDSSSQSVSEGPVKEESSAQNAPSFVEPKKAEPLLVPQPVFEREQEEPPALTLDEDEDLFGDPKSTKPIVKPKQPLKHTNSNSSAVSSCDFNQTEPPPLNSSDTDDEEDDDSTMPGKLNNAAFSSLLSSKLAMGPPPLGGRPKSHVGIPDSETTSSSRPGPSLASIMTNRPESRPEPSGRDLFKEPVSSRAPKMEFVTKNRPKGPPRRPPSNLTNLRSRTEEPEAPSSSSMYSSVNFRSSSNQQPAPKSLRPASSAAAIGVGSSSRPSRDAPRSGSNIAPTDGVVIRPTNESSKPGSGASNRLGSSTSTSSRPSSTAASSSNRLSSDSGKSATLSGSNRLGSDSGQRRDSSSGTSGNVSPRGGLPPRSTATGSTASSSSSRTESAMSQRQKEEAALDELLASMDNIAQGNKDMKTQRKSSSSSISGSESKQQSPRMSASMISSSPNSNRLGASNDKSPSFLPPSASKTMPASGQKKTIFSSDSDEDNLFKPIAKPTGSSSRPSNQMSSSMIAPNRLSQPITTTPRVGSSQSQAKSAVLSSTTSIHKPTTTLTSSRVKPKSLFDDSDDDLDLFRKKK
ncbi:hypothetical protein WR25_04390 [Diploscapter pachys]|uniref:Uncharacterized protein n=1 Tax=Diploscapter pachys TaxID=2018661 RepID=A0A2A2JW98_9BILA|nr:hypothetical protein WR25_04390 [Diploscapter pachys]